MKFSPLGQRSIMVIRREFSKIVGLWRLERKLKTAVAAAGLFWLSAGNTLTCLGESGGNIRNYVSAYVHYKTCTTTTVG